MNNMDLWTDLPAELRWHFESHSQDRDYKRGDYIYRQGDRPQGVYFVKQGLVGLMLLGPQSGKEHLVRFFRASQFFGHRSLFSDEGYHGNTVVMEATKIKFLPREVVLAAIEKHPELLRDVVRVLSKELRRCENHQVMILENQILPRVAQSLIYLKNLKPDHNWTRQEIANFCASTVSTVIKAMAELEELGLIEQQGRSITLVDRDGLLQLQESIDNLR
jgi:CRP-like cAMP-binding protein